MSLRTWLSHAANTYALKLVAVYGVGIILLLAGAVLGYVGPIVASSHWVASCIFSLLVLHVLCAFLALRHFGKGGRFNPHRAISLLTWMEKIDTSILAIGFLGKLAAIAVVTGAVVTSGDPTAAAAGLGAIAHGVSAALYSTMAGLAISMWTHCSTLVVANALKKVGLE